MLFVIIVCRQPVEFRYNFSYVKLPRLQQPQINFFKRTDMNYSLFLLANVVSNFNKI